jgi:hypothetical protein
MSISTRLTGVFESAPSIPFDDTAKFIFFSDCHRGDNGWADDFAPNQMLFFHALRYYFHEGFTYIELGDGDELWENASFNLIRRAHSHIFWLLHQFYAEGRFHLLFGNHNIQWKYPQNVKEKLSWYYDERKYKKEPLFEGITVHEGLILQHADSDLRLFLVHGHQGDIMSDYLWPLGSFFVRNVWRQFQLLGVRDPTSPAQNFKKRGKVERGIMDWIQRHNQPTLCGHTHRSMLPAPGALPYFNIGSCVHPRCITGVEIQNGEISLIKWWVAPDDDGALRITRDLLIGPWALSTYST